MKCASINSKDKLMFKILILQALYNLSDDEMEYQIMARLSFMRFLSLDPDSCVPDAKTIWLFRSKQEDRKLIGKLFDRFNCNKKRNHILCYPFFTQKTLNFFLIRLAKGVDWCNLIRRNLELRLEGERGAVEKV